MGHVDNDRGDLKEIMKYCERSVCLSVCLFPLVLALFLLSSLAMMMCMDSTTIQCYHEMMAYRNRLTMG